MAPGASGEALPNGKSFNFFSPTIQVICWLCSKVNISLFYSSCQVHVVIRYLHLMNKAIETVQKPNKQRMEKDAKAQYRNHSGMFF